MCESYYTTHTDSGCTHTTIESTRCQYNPYPSHLDQRPEWEGIESRSVETQCGACVLLEQFTAERYEQGEATRRVAEVLMGKKEESWV